MFAISAADIDGPPARFLSVEEIKWLLPVGLSLVIGFFYVAEFFAQHSRFDTVVLFLLALSLIVGVIALTSAPAAIRDVAFDSVVCVMLGAAAVQFGISTAGLTSMQSAA